MAILDMLCPVFGYFDERGWAWDALELAAKACGARAERDAARAERDDAIRQHRALLREHMECAQTIFSLRAQVARYEEQRE